MMALSIAPSIAQAACFPPAAPREAQNVPPALPYVVIPTTPRCFASYEYSGNHSCGQQELNRYLSSLQRYQDQLDRFHEDLVTYAQQKVRQSGLMVEYADDMRNYLNCKIDEAFKPIGY